jgi:8-oxo-dGTP diphosphatase
MTDVNLCIIENNGKILLKLATRGVGKGKWNFPGGKADNGETPEQAAIRETFEETGLKIDKLEKVAYLKFYDWGELAFDCYVYKAGSFSGKLHETEEGPLKWFDKKNLPFDLMWEADVKWVPLITAGNRIDEAEFWYGKGLKNLKEYKIRLATSKSKTRV